MSEKQPNPSARSKPIKKVNVLPEEINTLDNNDQEINQSTNLSSIYEVNFISEKRIKPNSNGKPKKTVNG